MQSLHRTFNPFAKAHVSDYPDVWIPLEQAKRHRSIIAMSKMSRDPSVVETELNNLSPAVSRLDSTVTSGSNTKLTIQSLQSEVSSELEKGIPGHDTLYDRKAIMINKAIQDIGMGKYQWQAFLLAGCGWCADQLWLQGIATTLTGMRKEFGKSEETIRYTTLSLFLGLCIGASFWGIASDVIGRRLAFNSTLLVAGAFGLAAGFAPTWVGTCALISCVGLGVGGNLPVDGALFLEFLPTASGALLTLLSVWWPIGQLLASVISWGFVDKYGDVTAWRYTIHTCGALTLFMCLCRVFLFQFFETPKFLLSRGRQDEAVAVVHGIAHINKTKTWLSEEVLNNVPNLSSKSVTDDSGLTILQIIKRGLGKFSAERVGPLFNKKKLGITTVLLWFIWTAIGMGYPLYNAFLIQYLAQVANKDTPTTLIYRNYVIASVVGVPGSIIACFIVNVKHVGRKGTMAISTILSGVFLILFIQSRTTGFQLAMISLEAFFQNITYGVLFAYTPEILPAPVRGTGTGIASFLNRLAGLSAPLVAINVGRLDQVAPVYAAAGCFFAAAVAMLLLPIETRGKQSL